MKTYWRKRLNDKHVFLCVYVPHPSIFSCISFIKYGLLYRKVKHCHCIFSLLYQGSERESLACANNVLFVLSEPNTGHTCVVYSGWFAILQINSF